MRTFIHARLLLRAAVMFALTAPLYAQLSGTPREFKAAALNESQPEIDCALDSEAFPLKAEDLIVMKSDGGILFTAGMTIDADGAPNAYGPRNRGLDFTANARGAHGWVALVTNKDGHPIVQKSGTYRGYYVSTTSLQQADVSDERNPKRYVDATKIPYIALPADFAARFNINLGDVAVVVNQANGRSAYAIFADVGPKGRIGEGSVALAKALGIPANPRHNSAVSGITYLIFPGSSLPSGTRITAHKIKSSAARLYHRWGGTQRLHTCDLLVAKSNAALN